MHYSTPQTCLLGICQQYQDCGRTTSRSAFTPDQHHRPEPPPCTTRTPPPPPSTSCAPSWPACAASTHSWRSCPVPPIITAAWAVSAARQPGGPVPRPTELTPATVVAKAFVLKDGEGRTRAILRM